MKTIFYVIVALLLVYELIVLMNIKTVFKSVQKYRNISKDLKRTSRKVEAGEYSQTFLLFSIFNIFYFIFTIIGFMSSQWILFALLFILSIIPKNYISLRYIDSIISISILVFILLNKYHLHINLLSLCQK